MHTLTISLLVHTLISFSAARWWLRPLLKGFDKKYHLPPCKESDFYFFCFTWSIVVSLIMIYAVWALFLRKLVFPLYRATMPKRVRRMHQEAVQHKDPLLPN